MKTRSVSHLLYAHLMDMGGLPIRQLLPTQQVQQVDPFLLLHHANIKVPVHRSPLHSGVDPHPHRGFSPVTFVFEGGVHHRDSRGNNSVVYAGGAQWMNAGMGIIHSERPAPDIHDIGGRQEIIQLWINTPAKHKMDQPSYFPLQASEVPSVTSEDGLIRTNVFAGDLKGVKGKVDTLSPVNAATVYAKQGGRIGYQLPENHHVLVYLLDGKIKLDGYGITEGLHLIYFKQDGEGISFEASEDTRLLLLSGEPLNEPIVSHGPFVMNNQTQIMEAMRDYQMGKMGILVEE